MNDQPLNIAVAGWFDLPFDQVRGWEIIATMSGAGPGDDAFVFVLYAQGAEYFVAEDSYCDCCSSPEFKPRQIERSHIQQVLTAAAETIAGIV